MIGLEFLYVLMGVLTGGVALVNLFDRAAPKHLKNALFWGLYSATFLLGSHLGDLANGVLVIAMVLTAGLGGLGGGRADATTREQREASARRWGNWLFVPALVIPALTLLGTLTLKSASRPREVPFAAIPLLFAIQQLSEGVIWLTFRYEAPQLNTVMTHVYSFFSHVLWPAYVPVAVLLIEPVGRRRRALLAFVAAGVAVGAYLLYVLVAFPVVSRTIGQHVEYVSPHFFAAAVMTLYLLSTAFSPILSTHRMVKVFGVLALSSFALAYGFYATWFISVWCFFAALLSAVVYLQFLPRKAAA